MKCYDKNKKDVYVDDIVIYKGEEYEVDELADYNQVKLLPPDSSYWHMWIDAQSVTLKETEDDKFAEWCRIYNTGAAA